MDLYRLKVFGAMLLICLAGVNASDAIDALVPSQALAQPQKVATAVAASNHGQSLHGKLLSDAKDETAAPNATNLTEARITSITFRTVDGDAEPAAVDRDSGETISFGIRSFTVKVAPAGTEKPIPLGDVVSQNGQPFLLPEHIVPAKQPLRVEVLNERDNVRDQAPPFDAQKMPAKASRGSMVSESNVFGAAPRPVDAHKTGGQPHEHLSLSSNGMHVEQKLENGLYRIKIAEIITDEFNNGLSSARANEHQLNEIEHTIQRYPKPTHTSAQINIADLFPSKMEDFASIIRDSNEKLIREKNRMVGAENDEHVDGSRVNVVDGASGKHSINVPNREKAALNHRKAAGEKKMAAPAEKVVDEPMHGQTTGDKETDFTSKLQVNDEMISQIEHSFRESSEPHPPIEPVILLNRPMQFIERRVKKWRKTVPTTAKAPATAGQRPSADSIDANTISPVDEEQLDAKKGKLAVAQHNKDGRSDGVRAAKKSTAKSLATEATAATPSNRHSFAAQIFDERNTANGTAGQSHGQRKALMPSTLETITAGEQEFLFINVNDNRTRGAQIDAGEMARLQNARHQIIEDSKRQPNDTPATHAQPSSGMHVYIMHGDRARTNQTTWTNYNDTIGNGLPATPSTDQANADGTVSQPPSSPPSLSPATSNAPTPIDASSLPLLASTPAPEPIARRPAAEPSQPHPVPSTTLAPARAHSAVGYMSKPFGRQRGGGYDSFALDTECDMQTPIPADATLWRGNETHELNLPTTVSVGFLLRGA